MCPLRIAVREGIFLCPTARTHQECSTLYLGTLYNLAILPPPYTHLRIMRISCSVIAASSVLRVDVFLYIFYIRRAVRLS